MFDNKLPTVFTVINNPSKPVNLQIEARRVRLKNNTTPMLNNAWCYVKVPAPQPAGTSVLSNYLGPVINVTRNKPCTINWINTLVGMKPMPGMSAMQEAPPINPVPMGAICIAPTPMMQPSVGVAAHLHGGKVQHDADGWPLQPAGYVGNPYGFPSILTYIYPNQQRAAMLWFHDHAMDNTAPQVHAGLAGLYFIRDQSDTDIFNLIGGKQQELPLVIQDRNLNCNFHAVDYWAGIPTDCNNPDFAPDGFYRPEFLGETIFVNGRATPYHEVNRAIYRLRILNGSNARTYALALMDPFWWANANHSSRIWYSDCLRVIGNEAGLISPSSKLNATDYLLLAPGERLDVLLDLTDVALTKVNCLRLVNLALVSNFINTPTYLFTPPDPKTRGLEGIFQSDGLSVFVPNSPTDASLNNALKLGQANIMQFCLPSSTVPGATSLNTLALDQLLKTHGDDKGFVLDTASGKLKPNPANVFGTQEVRNRFVLLMNNNTPSSSTPPPYPISGGDWQDTQIWELGEAGMGPDWSVPFDVDTAAPNPAPGNHLASKTYSVLRTTFFQSANPPIIGSPTMSYPTVHAPSFQPKAGTYERWYVANIGNFTPVDVVDMHPFHMHLVNFVVTNRWVLNATGTFDPVAVPRALDFDGIARHDTVRVQSNELVELLVYFPPGYLGDYVYHCHLVEHEDMGMMLHFQTIP